MILLDTNVVIGYIASDDRMVEIVDQTVRNHGDIALATIVVVELLAYPLLQDSDLRKIAQFIEQVTLLELTAEIAKHAGKLRRDTKLATADAVIASTALAHEISLLSRDQDFKKVSGLKLLVP